MDIVLVYNRIYHSTIISVTLIRSVATGKNVFEQDITELLDQNL